MSTNLVLVINDSLQSTAELRSIAGALVAVFTGRGESFEVEQPWLANLAEEPIGALVSKIELLEPAVLLVDANMPANYRDGIRLINAVRRVGYSGFTYLWSASDTTSDVELFPAMLKGTGTGGFLNSDRVGLAHKVFTDWEACARSFQLADPVSMSLGDPLDLALQILSEFVAGCLLSESKCNNADDWNAACSEASALFNGQPGNFRSVASSFPDYDTLHLEDASDSIKQLSQTDCNDHGAIFKALRSLRDSLLDVAKSCEDIDSFVI